MMLKREFTNGSNTHVSVKHTGLKAEQNFSRRLVLQAVNAGWMRVAGGRLVIKTGDDEDDLEYTVNREPGYYCKSTGERMPITSLAWEQLLSERVGTLAYAEAQAWLKGAGKAADDYEITMAYECVLDEALHEKYRGVQIKPGVLRAAHTVEG
jgi:hypothetical protein